MQEKLKKNAEISARILRLLEYLNVTANSFAMTLGYKRAQTIYDVVNGKSAPSFDFFNRLAMSEYSESINMDWLLTGRGEIFKTKSTENVLKQNEDIFEDIFEDKRELPKTSSNVTRFSDSKYSVQRLDSTELDARMQRIPIYEMMTMLNLNTLFAGKLQPTDYMMLPNLPKCDGAVYMHGDMMHPDIQRGDIIVFRKVKDLREGLLLGNMYLVSLELDGIEYVMVQYIHQSEEKEHVKLVSRNEKYPPKDVPLASIKTLAMIKASIRYNTMM